MVVFRSNKDERIKGSDLRRPPAGVFVRVLAHARRHRLVEEWQVEIFDVHEFELGVATFLRDFVRPFGDRRTLAARTRAPDDDGNSKHKNSLDDYAV